MIPYTLAYVCTTTQPQKHSDRPVHCLGGNTVLIATVQLCQVMWLFPNVCVQVRRRRVITVTMQTCGHRHNTDVWLDNTDVWLQTQYRRVVTDTIQTCGCGQYSHNTDVWSQTQYRRVVTDTIQTCDYRHNTGVWSQTQYRRVVTDSTVTALTCGCKHGIDGYYAGTVTIETCSDHATGNRSLQRFTRVIDFKWRQALTAVTLPLSQCRTCQIGHGITTHWQW